MLKRFLLILIVLLTLIFPAIYSRSSESTYKTQGVIKPLSSENIFANFTASLFNIHFDSFYKFNTQCNVSFFSFSSNALELNVSSIFFALYNNSIGSSNLFLLDTFSVYPNQILVPGQSLQFNISLDGSITQPNLSKGYFLYLNFDQAFLFSNQSSWIPVSSHNNLFTIPIPSSGSFISSTTENVNSTDFSFLPILFAMVFLPFLKQKF